MSPLARRLVLLGAFCCLVVVARVGFSGLSEYRQGQDLEEEQQWHEAAVHYGRAIHMYLPLSPLPGRAAQRLGVLAKLAQARNEPREARFCFEEMRSGFLAVRSFYQPGRKFIDQAEAELATLMLADTRGNWPDRTLTEDERRTQVEAVLAEREDPSLLWVLVMGIGYLGWIGGAGLAIWRGLPASEDEPIAWSELKRYGALSLLAYGLWLLGVALA